DRACVYRRSTTMAKRDSRKPVIKKKANPLKTTKLEGPIDYKDTALLRKFISDRGKIRAPGDWCLHPRAAADREGREERPRDGPAALLELRSLREGSTAMATKLILTREVTGLGTAGDVVEVKDGYARNHLLPRNPATPWTKGGQKQIDQITAARRKHAIAT